MDKCGICEHNIYEKMLIKNVPVYTFSFSDATLNFTIGECSQCGAVQLIGVPLSDTYKENHRSIGNTIEYREKKKQELKEFLNKYNLVSGDMIEIGCGNGQYLEILRELGYECDGWEAGEKNKLECQEKGFNFQHNKLQYNSVFCFYYLEHMPDPVNFIINIYNMLREDGVCLIEVPNYDYIEKNRLWLEFTRDHRFYYRKRTLMYLLLKCGFEIESINSEGLCLSVVVRKPFRIGFYAMDEQIKKDINKFNELTKTLGDYAIIGAGHYTQLLLNQIDIKPKYVFDSVPMKVGYKLCGIEIRHQNDIVNMIDCDNIIISCGMYNREAFNNIKKLVPNKRIVIWE
jgi:SAM-dependent methyltransferase